MELDDFQQPFALAEGGTWVLYPVLFSELPGEPTETKRLRAELTDNWDCAIDIVQLALGDDPTDAQLESWWLARRELLARDCLVEPVNPWPRLEWHARKTHVTGAYHSEGWEGVVDQFLKPNRKN